RARSPRSAPAQRSSRFIRDWSSAASGFWRRSRPRSSALSTATGWTIFVTTLEPTRRPSRRSHGRISGAFLTGAVVAQTGAFSKKSGRRFSEENAIKSTKLKHRVLDCCLLGRALRQDALQRAAVHVEPARRFRNIAAAQLINTLDVLPAHAIGRHRIFWRIDSFVVEGEQGRGHIVSIDRLGQIIDRPEFDRGDRSRDVAVAGEDDGARFRPALFHRRNNIEAVAVGQPHVDNRKGGRRFLDL